MTTEFVEPSMILQHHIAAVVRNGSHPLPWRPGKKGADETNLYDRNGKIALMCNTPESALDFVEWLGSNAEEIHGI